jgi:hypothetical protein
MAAKYEELVTPRASKFIESCKGLYTCSDVVSMEREVLECVGFCINKIVLLRSVLFNRVDEMFRTSRFHHFN